MRNVDEQIRIIAKGAAEIIELADLKEKLERARKEQKPLTVKLGLDPTAPDLHLGHAVVLRKIRQIQELGHKAVIILGDFTAMIGDPTGKSKTRKQLSHEEVLENAKTYKEQLFKILIPEKTEVRFNSEWLSKLSFGDVLKLSAKTTVARILEREDFKNRFQNNSTIGLHELFYPLMQGYDSVALESDIEIGGTEQRFNILMGRDLQRHFGQESQIALFMPVLEGTDGVEKMSKSLGNSIGLNEAPEVMFEKIMTIPDSLIIRFFELCTDLPPDEVSKIKARLENGENPRQVKIELAREIVRLYHGEEASLKAQEHFDLVFKDKGVPQDIPALEAADFLDETGKTDLVKVLTSADFAASSSEARRLILQGGVKLNGDKVMELRSLTRSGDVLQAGKKHFVRLI
ncbi:MAG: tyrosine--tRNA ligase [Clostridia bacterium]|nr:tyrosine--tRNA ligase [Clostridia bacterium]